MAASGSAPASPRGSSRTSTPCRRASARPRTPSRGAARRGCSPRRGVGSADSGRGSRPRARRRARAAARRSRPAHPRRRVRGAAARRGTSAPRAPRGCPRRAGRDRGTRTGPSAGHTSCCRACRRACSRRAWTGPARRSVRTSRSRCRGGGRGRSPAARARRGARGRSRGCDEGTSRSRSAPPCCSPGRRGSCPRRAGRSVPRARGRRGGSRRARPRGGGRRHRSAACGSSRRRSHRGRGCRSRTGPRPRSRRGGRWRCLDGQGLSLPASRGSACHLGDLRAEASGVPVLELEPVARPRAIGSQDAALRLGNAVEHDSLDPDVVVEVLEMPPPLDGAERMRGDRRRAVGGDVDRMRVREAGGGEEARDPSAARHVGLQAVHAAHEVPEVGRDVRVLAGRYLEPGRTGVADEAQPLRGRRRRPVPRTTSRSRRRCSAPPRRALPCGRKRRSRRRRARRRRRSPRGRRRGVPGRARAHARPSSSRAGSRPPPSRRAAHTAARLCRSRSRRCRRSGRPHAPRPAGRRAARRAGAPSGPTAPGRRRRRRRSRCPAARVADLRGHAQPGGAHVHRVLALDNAGELGGITSAAAASQYV